MSNRLLVKTRPAHHEHLMDDGSRRQDFLVRHAAAAKQNAMKFGDKVRN